MNDSNTHINLFTKSGCLTTEALKGYSSNELSSLQKEEVDRHLESCELCTDAMEGLQLLSDPQKINSIVSEINKNLKSNILQKQLKKNTVPNRLFYYAAAASVIILFGLYFYLQNNFKVKSTSSSTSQVIDLDEKNIPPMPKAKLEELYPLEKNQTKPADNIAPSTQQEVTDEIMVKTEVPETVEPIIPEQMMMEEEDVTYVAPLKTLRGPESIPKSLAMEEIALDDEETIEAKAYAPADIASTQPVEYYIGGIVVYDKGYEQAVPLSYSTKSSGSKGSSSAKKRSIPQTTAIDSNREKSQNKQEEVLVSGQSDFENEEDITSENHFFSLGSEVPQFPGGYEALIVFLNTHLNYPKEAREKGFQGRLVISFIVEENGEISSATIVHGIGGGCDEEAIRVIESMPDWEPALKDNKPVRVLFNMPITFKLN